MLHPSTVAIDFIFHRLQQSHLAPSDHALLKALASLQSALAHRPSDPSSPAHQALLHNQLGALRALRAQHPHLELAAEEGALRKALLD
jgi:hypothetical protein